MLTRIATAALLAAALLIATPAEAGRRGAEAPAEGSGSPPGNLAVTSLRVYPLNPNGADSRTLLRALVENQSPSDREGTWVLVFRDEKKHVLGECTAELLPQGQIAVCEVWIDGVRFGEGDKIEARLDRGIGRLGSWDMIERDDAQVIDVQTLSSDGETPLRIAAFEVSPRVLQGMGEIRYDYSVEGARLAWIISPGSEPRIIDGRPDDGLISGQGRLKVSSSGPVTIIARNESGTFAFRTIPVTNRYRPPKKTWLMSSNAAVTGPVPATILDPGVYDVANENAAIIEDLKRHIDAKDWAYVDSSRPSPDMQREAPEPASVLNPGRDPRRR